MSEPTVTYSIEQLREREIKRTLREVGEALREKGYNPINQIVGYIMSEDPTYITTHKNARTMMLRLDRDDVLQAMVKEYLEIE